MAKCGKFNYNFYFFQFFNISTIKLILCFISHNNLLRSFINEVFMTPNGVQMSSSAQSGISYEAINKKNESVIT